LIGISYDFRTFGIPGAFSDGIRPGNALRLQLGVKLTHYSGLQVTAMSLSLELKQCKIEQRNAIVKHWLKVLIFLSAALLINQPVWALEFGEPPPKVELKEKLGGRLDAKPWSSDELQGKLSIIFYVSPDEKDTNNPASEAVDKEKFPADRFRSYGIVNMAASMLPNFIINSALKEKQERYPRTIYVRDYNKVLVHAWKIADHSSNVMVFDEKGNLIFRKDGKLTAEEIQKLIKTIRDNL